MVKTVSGSATIVLECEGSTIKEIIKARALKPADGQRQSIITVSRRFYTARYMPVMFVVYTCLDNPGTT